ncbi:MAG: ribonuclease H [Pseudomonadota bacterium]
MQRHLYLDIETIPAQRPDVLAEIREGLQTQLAADIDAICAPGNYKDPEKITAWMSCEGQAKAQALRNTFDADVDAAYRKTGLDGAFGQICVIGWALEDGDVRAQHCLEWARPEAEKAVLVEFAATLTEFIPRSEELSTTVIGHNVAGFDLRYLMQRHIVNGVKPHGIIGRASQAKPWELDRVFDTMVQWAGIGRTISLEKLCKALSIKSPKGDITGATVWDAVRDGRIADVAAYCAGDIRATREVHKRLTFA